MRPPLPRTEKHCSVKTEFGYFAGGGFADRPAPPDSPATTDYQLNEQHQIQEVEDAAEDVAVGVMQESDEIHRVDFFNYSPNLASLTAVVWPLLFKFPHPRPSAQESQTKNRGVAETACDHPKVSAAVYFVCSHLAIALQLSQA